MVDFPKYKIKVNTFKFMSTSLIIVITIMLTCISEFILSIDWSNLFEYIIGANSIGTTSKGKSRRRLNNKTFLSSLLISRKKFNFQNSK